MSKKSIGIIGAGAIGLAIAAEYVFNGWRVLMAEADGFIHRLPPAGHYSYTGLSFKRGHLVEPVSVEVKTVSDYRELNQSEGVIVATTALAHEKLLARLADLLNVSLPIVVICGNGSTLAHLSTRALSAETSTAPYGARIEGGDISVKVLTPKFGVAALSEKEGEIALEILKAVYPEAFRFQRVADAILSNPNPLFHVSIMLANLTRIDRRELFAFYAEGVTESVEQLIRAKDQERMVIAHALGSSPVLFDDLEGAVQMEGLLVTQHFLECGSYARVLAPTSVNNRYLTEDVPYGLAVWEALGKRETVPTPVISAEINQTSAILNRDLRNEVSRRTAAITERA